MTRFMLSSLQALSRLMWYSEPKLDGATVTTVGQALTGITRWCYVLIERLRQSTHSAHHAIASTARRKADLATKGPPLIDPLSNYLSTFTEPVVASDELGKVTYVASHGLLFRSADVGASWQKLIPLPDKISSASFSLVVHNDDLYIVDGIEFPSNPAPQLWRCSNAKWKLVRNRLLSQHYKECACGFDA